MPLFCPKCKGNLTEGHSSYACQSCDFTYYAGPNPATGVILINPEGHVYLGRRTREPGKGLWDLPGGFIEFHESAEDGARREIKEELGIDLDEVKLFCSYPNIYPYKGLEYYPLDIFLIARISEDKCLSISHIEEFSEGRFFKPEKLPLDELAFESQRKALSDYLNMIKP
ncbi:NUDIX domain-containing protein [Candidatus Falkowbacteria bacterium]|nr:NUDIX domain-containing protein [Candidatus Falkowbacteria bacterium]